MVIPLLTWPGLSQRLQIKHLFQFLYTFLLQSSCLFLQVAAISPPSLRKKICWIKLIISSCTAFFLFPSCYRYTGAHCDPVSPRIQCRKVSPGYSHSGEGAVLPRWRAPSSAGGALLWIKTGPHGGLNREGLATGKMLVLWMVSLKKKKRLPCRLLVHFY